MVVFCHVVEQTFASTTITDRFFAMAFHTIGRSGVPLFFMLSGFYLLNKTYDAKGIKRFYLNSFLPLLLCWEIWIIIFNVSFVIEGQKFVGLAELIKEMFFFRGVGTSQEWYMPAILIIYAIIPFVANGLKSIKLKYTLIVFGILFLFQFIIPTFSNSYPIFLNYLNLCYISYLIIGYLLNYYLKIKVKNIFNFIGIFVAYAGAFAWQFYKSNYGQVIFNYWYDSAFLPIIGFFIFSAISNCVRIVDNKFLYRLSTSTFGVYLVHSIILNILKKNLIINNIYLRIFALLFLVSAISYLISILISYIPYVGHYLIHSKKADAISLKIN